MAGVTFVTWTRPDTSTTLSVRHFCGQGLHAPRLAVAPADVEGDLASVGRLVCGATQPIDGAGRTVHAFELSGLTPGADYRFVVLDGTEPVGSERRARTLPRDGRPVRIAVGGDVDIDEATFDVAAAAAQHRPAAVLFGGDLAYENGDRAEARRWDALLGGLDEAFSDDEGRCVPFIAAIGNHEVAPSTTPTAEHAPFWFALFTDLLSPSAPPTYFHRRLGRDAVVVVLDSGHVSPHDGAQAAWLERALEAHERHAFLFALYHAPLYPSHRPFDEPLSLAGREAWGPLFSRFDVSACFENHDHVLKRTRPIRHGDVGAAGGTVFLGDGCFGAAPREPRNDELGYLARAEGVRHSWIVDVTPRGARAFAVGADGEVLDRVELVPRPRR